MIKVSERKRISERLMVKIILRHKEHILDALSLEQEINDVIQKFANRTGRTIEQIEVVKNDGSYTLKLGVTI